MSSPSPGPSPNPASAALPLMVNGGGAGALGGVKGDVARSASMMFAKALQVHLTEYVY